MRYAWSCLRDGPDLGCQRGAYDFAAWTRPASALSWLRFTRSAESARMPWTPVVTRVREILGQRLFGQTSVWRGPE